MTKDGGAVDLGLQVDGGLAASDGRIFGVGLLDGMTGGQAAFVMAEPATGLAVAACGLGQLGWRRSRRAA